MKTLRMLMAAACVAAMTMGCIQDQKILKLNRDGSGTLVEEIYMSPQLTGMMEQMTAGMAQAMGQAGAADKAKAKAALDPLAMFKTDIEKRAAELGPGVKLVSSQAKTNDKGWKGYIVTFSFADINKLNLTMGGKNEGGGGGMESGKKKKEEPMLLEFRKSPQPAIMFRQKATAKAAPKATESGAAEAMPGAEAMPAAMLAPMLQGMRINFIVEVDGKITRTNSHYKQGDNRIVLMDMQMDKVLASPEGAKLIGGGQDDPALLNKIRDLKIPGLAIEDMERGIAIEWQ